MIHYQDPREKWYWQPACGATKGHGGDAMSNADSPYITCRACLAILARQNEADE